MVHEVRIRAAGFAQVDGRVLVQRKRGDEYWALPGGRIEPGEVSHEALTRELHEELNISASVGEIRLVLENRFLLRGKSYQSVEFYYNLQLDVDPETIKSAEADLEYSWIDLQHADPLVQPIGVIRVLSEGRGFLHLTVEQL